MERLEKLLRDLKTFALTRPVAYGAPVCAAVGLLAGLGLRTGPQDGPYAPAMEPVRVARQDFAEPIAWPTGKVPDYVIGTDFLKAMEPPPAIEYAAFEPPPPPEVPPYEPARHGPAARPPDPDLALESHRWPSQRGDILDVSLPEDRAPEAIPTVMASADPAIALAAR